MFAIPSGHTALKNNYLIWREDIVIKLDHFKMDNFIFFNFDN